MYINITYFIITFELNKFFSCKREKLELYLFEVMIDAYVFKFNIFFKFKRIFGKLQSRKFTIEKYV